MKARNLTCIAVGGICLALTLTLSGCSILFGNIKPVSEKSDTFKVMELDKVDSTWVKLDTQAEYEQALAQETSDSPPSSELDASDLAYQNKKNAAIISINSACRPRNALEDNSLSQFTDALLLGMGETSDRTAIDLTLQGHKALETNLNGTLNNQKVKLSIVVLKRETCVYDLMLVSRPKFFESQKKIFDSFVASLRF